jgi:ankyrin repeat protein
MNVEFDSDFEFMTKHRWIEETPLFVAYLEYARRAVRCGDNNPSGPFKTSLIHWVAMLNCSKLLQFLLSNDVPVDSLDQNKRTPLSWAAEYHALEAVKILVKHGAEVNSMDFRYYTPLRYAVLSDLEIDDIDRKPAVETFLQSHGAKEQTIRGWISKTFFWP